MTLRWGVRDYVLALCGCMVILSAVSGWTQSNPPERTFPQSKAAIEKALKGMQANMAGHLPILEGFANAGDHPLDRYERGYYQATAEVVSNPSGGSLVRIKAKVTAWYSDPSSSHSRYQVLTSNGRLESDLLDQLAEQLAATPSEKAVTSNAVMKAPPEASKDERPSAPEPSRKFPETNSTISSSAREWAASASTADKSSESPSKPDSSLKAEADNLEEILKNVAHPKNLVAVKKSGTPVVSTPSLTAKPQFLASLHDEFEMLDFNADWVHVRISGLSRGWIWRNSVEMPEGIADNAAFSSGALNTAADLFHVVREETAPFPGDWEPLRGKNVKIISVQKIDETEKNAGSKERLEYTKFLLEKSYPEIAEKKSELAGVVVVFDSADGGMIAATTPTLRQWRAGALNDSALWHKCFFDPPETFDSAGSSGSW
ncbi:MAG TPA: hypothetical protein VJP02_27980 [Candidatus Sulfotelmatobacter sp.]|nr:hypothetical protein [Candidatus Sulfotelmatobacter sp.]